MIIKDGQCRETDNRVQMTIKDGQCRETDNRVQKTIKDENAEKLTRGYK